MKTRLELVSDRGVAVRHRPARRTPPEGSLESTEHADRAAPACGAARELLEDDSGAITAEYAVVIMAAVAFAGLLVAIMRSNEIRTMLVQLVENALGTGG
jgi:hypothetical protein